MLSFRERTAADVRTRWAFGCSKPTTVSVGSPTEHVPHADAPEAIHIGATSAAIAQQPFTARSLGLGAGRLYVANRRSAKPPAGEASLRGLAAGWEFRELALERAPVNTQSFRGLGDVPVAVRQHALDVLPFDSRQ